jgi:hypothetical protein
MSPSLLVALYLGAGVVCGVVVFRRTRSPASAIATVALWPLWAPFAAGAAPAPRGAWSARIAAALTDAAAAGAGTAAEAALRRDEVAGILGRVEEAERRLAELDARVAALGRDALATSDGVARARADTVAQLEALRDRDRRALDELAALCELLRTQLVLARFGAADRTPGLRDELSARVQALS